MPLSLTSRSGLRPTRASPCGVGWPLKLHAAPLPPCGACPFSPQAAPFPGLEANSSSLPFPAGRIPRRGSTASSTRAGTVFGGPKPIIQHPARTRNTARRRPQPGNTCVWDVRTHLPPFLHLVSASTNKQHSWLGLRARLRGKSTISLELHHRPRNDANCHSLVSGMAGFPRVEFTFLVLCLTPDGEDFVGLNAPPRPREARRPVKHLSLKACTATPGSLLAVSPMEPCSPRPAEEMDEC